MFHRKTKKENAKFVENVMMPTFGENGMMSNLGRTAWCQLCGKWHDAKFGENCMMPNLGITAWC